MVDYKTLTIEQLAETLYGHVADFEDEETAYDLTVDRILAAVNSGSAVFEVEKDAIAVVRPEGWRETDGNAVLWLLFVGREARGNGVGKAFVRRLRTKHESRLPMILACNGDRRVAFFESCGFLVKERDDDWVAMLSNTSHTT